MRTRFPPTAPRLGGCGEESVGVAFAGSPPALWGRRFAVVRSGRVVRAVSMARGAWEARAFSPVSIDQMEVSTMKNIYVGNLPFQTTDEDLRAAFEQHGEVSSATVIFDRETQRSRGFGFVEMPNAGEAESAIEALNGSDMGGRSLRVNEARPREERRPPRRSYGH